MRRLLGWVAVAWLIALAVVTPGYAQAQPPIQASVDRTSLAVGETMQLTVAVNVAEMNPPAPELPVLNGFDVVGTSTSSQISLANGQMSAQVSYIYQLRATQAGEWTIDAINLTVNGQTYQTQPIIIQVTEGAIPGGSAGATPQPEPQAEAPTELSGQDFFIEAGVSDHQPYLGQAVTYVFRFYQAVNLFDQPYYDPPTFTGFWSESQSDQRQYDVNSAGRVYRVTELTTILYPTVTGDVTIEPAHLKISGGFFQSDQNLQTQPVELTIQPLPDGAPADFSGAVGQFDIAAEVDTDHVKVNEPVTLRVTVTGSGNLNSMPDPKWPEMTDWRVFDSQATTNSETNNGQISGSRVYERVMVPEKAGDFSVPSISYSYFDPQVSEYRTVSTLPIELSVAPATEEAATTVVVGANKEEVSLIAADIRHLKPVPTVLMPARPPITSSRVYWLLWGVPLLAVSGSLVWRRRQRRRQEESGWLRSSQAARKARRALTQAERSQSDSHAAAGQILDGYLSDKLNQPVAGLTHRALADLLHAHKLDEDLVQRILDCRRESEMGRYSPQPLEADQGRMLLQQVGRLIGDMEKQFS